MSGEVREDVDPGGEVSVSARRLRLELTGERDRVSKDHPPVLHPPPELGPQSVPTLPLRSRKNSTADPCDPTRVLQRFGVKRGDT